MNTNLVLRHVQKALLLVGLLGFLVGPLLLKVAWWLPLLTWFSLAVGCSLAYGRKSFSDERVIADRLFVLTSLVQFNEKVGSKSSWEIYLQALKEFIVFPTMKKASRLCDAFDQADTNYAIVRNVAGKALAKKIDELRALVRHRAILPAFLNRPH